MAVIFPALRPWHEFLHLCVHTLGKQLVKLLWPPSVQCRLWSRNSKWFPEKGNIKISRFYLIFCSGKSRRARVSHFLPHRQPKKAGLRLQKFFSFPPPLRDIQTLFFCRMAHMGGKKEEGERRRKNHRKTTFSFPPSFSSEERGFQSGYLLLLLSFPPPPPLPFFRWLN